MKVLLLLSMLVMAARGAGAADMKVVTTDDGGKLILLVGEMLEGDGTRFAAAASGILDAVVVFSSPGGSLIAGLRIGQYIRLHRFATLVPDGGSCASACALAWLGGTKRMMQSGGRIGFHAAYYKDRLGVAHVTAGGNALVGAYLGSLGLQEETILYIEEAAPNDMNWLHEQEARRLGIEVVTVPSTKRDPDPPKVVTPPPVASKDMAVIAISFTEAYFAHWSETNADALKYFRTIYFQRVAFYGQSIPATIVIDQKAQFAERWPERIYAVRSGSVKAECGVQNCDVTGVVDWDARNAEARKRSAGSAAFQLRVAFSGTRPLIVAETGKVLSREPDDAPATKKE